MDPFIFFAHRTATSWTIFPSVEADIRMSVLTIYNSCKNGMPNSITITYDQAPSHDELGAAATTIPHLIGALTFVKLYDLVNAGGIIVQDHETKVILWSRFLPDGFSLRPLINVY